MNSFGDAEEKDIVNPIDRHATDEEKVRQLNKLSEENKPKIEEFLTFIDEKYGTKSKTSKKDDHKIIEKAHRPRIKEQKEWFEVEHIRDAFRFKTVLENIEDLPKIAKDLRESGLCEVVKTDTAKVLKPDIFGWRIAVFDLKMANGQLVEYYLPVQELERAKAAGNHTTFEKWRDADEKTMTDKEKKEFRKATRESFGKYDEAWQSYLERTKQKPERVKETLDKTQEVLSKERTARPGPARSEVKENAPKQKPPGRLIQKLRDLKEKNKDDDLIR